MIDLIKKLRDKNVNGEDTRIIGKRLKEIETEHLTQKNLKSQYHGTSGRRFCKD